MERIARRRYPHPARPRREIHLARALPRLREQPRERGAVPGAALHARLDRPLDRLRRQLITAYLITQLAALAEQHDRAPRVYRGRVVTLEQMRDLAAARADPGITGILVHDGRTQPFAAVRPLEMA